MLTSLTWHFSTQSNNLWARVLQGKYCAPRATNPHTLTFTARVWLRLPPFAITEPFGILVPAITTISGTTHSLDMSIHYHLATSYWTITIIWIYCPLNYMPQSLPWSITPIFLPIPMDPIHSTGRLYLMEHFSLNMPITYFSSHIINPLHPFLITGYGKHQRLTRSSTSCGSFSGMHYPLEHYYHIVKSYHMPLVQYVLTHTRTSFTFSHQPPTFGTILTLLFPPPTISHGYIIFAPTMIQLHWTPMLILMLLSLYHTLSRLSQSHGNLKYSHIFTDCRSMMSYLHMPIIQHTFREGIGVADAMACFGKGLPFVDNLDAMFLEYPHLLSYRNYFWTQWEL